MRAEFKITTGDCLDTLRRMPDASIDAVVTDPPYGLGREPDPRDVLRAWLDGEAYQPGGAGFMGKAWDAFVPSPLVWAECWRVLKPGGHLLAFAGSRTYDWIVMGVRLAGFEVRDQLLWLYGSGFPKSLNVSKAIDRQRDDRDDVYRVTGWIREARDAAGVTNRQIDDAFGFSGMAGHWTSAKSQPSVPTIDQIPTLLAVLGVTLDDVPEEIRDLIWTLNGRKGQPGAAWFERQSTGTATDRGGFAGVRLGTAGNPSRDIPATEAAQRWDGWGTALKPAHEPIVMARKPLVGTVAHNVTTHGTGAINVDGCRVGSDARPAREPTGRNGAVYGAGLEGSRSVGATTQGRWPANIMHDGSAEVLAGFPVTTSGGGVRRPRDWSTDVFGMAQGASDYQRDASTGTAARFFYHAKASRAERERGLTHREPETVGDGRAVAIDNAYQRGATQRLNIHPTVKPVSVMRWLVRLVTPPGGTVLDPYTGSGTTGIAATLEGFGFIGCELSPEYHGIALARILDARANPHEWDPEIDAPAETEQDDSPDVGQTSLLDLV